MTGSVTSVDYSKLADSRPVTNSASLLQGASAGLYVRQTSGIPGNEGVSLRVRGTGTLNNSDPLVIVDGTPGSMDSVDPSEIQNISVLKDAASCAIYGNRGANGVILITTKREKKDSFHIDYSGMFGVQSPENTYDVVSNYADYMELMNEASFQNDKPLPFSQSMISLWREKEKDPYGISESGYPNYVAYPNVDGMTAFYRTDTPIYQKHNISAAGTSDKMSYRVALGYMNNPGMVENTGFKKYTFRAEFSSKLFSWLEVGARTYGYYNVKEAGDLNNVFNYAIRWVPCIYPYYDGKYGWYENPEQNSEARNNLYFLNRVQGKQVTESVVVTPFVNIDLPFGIKSRTLFKYSSTHMERDQHTITREAYSFRTGEVVASDQDLSSQVRWLTTQIVRSTYFESDLSWARTFAKNMMLPHCLVSRPSTTGTLTMHRRRRVPKTASFQNSTTCSRLLPSLEHPRNIPHSQYFPDLPMLMTADICSRSISDMTDRPDSPKGAVGDSSRLPLPHGVSRKKNSCREAASMN